MAKIKSIIIDDESNNIDVLVKTLQLYCPNVQVVATANDIKSGEEIIQEHQPQIVFLDVEMPFGNGFDLLAKLMPIDFDVIFTTAFNKYAVQAFKFSAIDYLLKPIDPTEIIAAVNKVTNKLEKNNDNQNIIHLLENIKTTNVLHKKMGIHTADAIVFEEIENIMYLKAEGSYTVVHLKHNKKETTTKTLKDFEEVLPQQIFCRIHNSYSININFIKKYHKGRGGYVEMEDATIIEVSQRKKEDFIAKLKV